MLYWIQEHPGIVFGVAGSLVAGLLGTMASLFVVVRLPADYLRRHNGESRGTRDKTRTAARIGRNILGWGLILAGGAMMVLPGPGLVVLLIGIAMADFPGKRRLLRWLVSRQGVQKSINGLRARFGRPPLEPAA